MQIITTHTGSDFDALASMVAGTFLYPGSIGVLPNRVNPEVKQFLAIHQDILRIEPRKTFDLEFVTSLVVVDTNNWKRLDKMQSLAEKTDLEIICWDHHMEGVNIKSTETHREEIGATITLLLEEMQRQDTPFTPIHATLFLLGIYADTGCLRYPSATARDAKMVSYLLENGADLNVVSAYLEDSVDDAHTEVFGNMLDVSEISTVDGLTVGICPLQIKSGLTSLAPLVTKYKEFKGVDIAFGVFLTDLDKSIIIGRGNPKAIDIGGIMRTMEGGGHPGAGSAIVQESNLVVLTEKLIEMVREGRRQTTTVQDIMSDPAIFMVHDNFTMQQAFDHFSTQRITGVMVCNGNTLIGSLSALDFAKAEQKGRMGTSVKGFAKRTIPILAPNTNSREALGIMNKAKEGILPVVEKDELKGVLTRGDIMLQMYDF